jgi:hypothetical protein
VADSPCNTCQNYDPILRGVKEGRHGRCVAKSTYPAAAQKGQVFPINAVRAPVGELAQPHIVVGTETVQGCADFRVRADAKRSVR